jgi:hypothetical protein
MRRLQADRGTNPLGVPLPIRCETTAISLTIALDGPPGVED